MPPQPDPAKLRRICSIGKSDEGKKLRVAGRVLSYDVQTGIVVLIDEGHGLYVDIVLSLDGQSRRWATERLSTIIALGDLERSEMRLGAPVIDGKGPALKINEELVLRAILVVPSPDLDLALWNNVLADEEEDDRER
ncbi:hypothetical protein M413DRAFT_446386 [Hebeloma cylindrosporum]|uniref:Uncharacterized protein n=1 Tax=Hebeloma cylindrosporum TaxID=76867 RepID=A0A0C3C7N1_HEBCY|nr:hypothetical protein M413DRAFT_446386 [Hebeloma cylindrosporum h7]